MATFHSIANEHPSGDPAPPIDVVTDEFVARLRTGEHPSITEYVERYPHLAEEIAEIFPTLAMLERAGKGVTAQVVAHPKLPALEQLGDYRILREVGRGGMGVVYEAEHTLMRRRVALKILPAELARHDTQLQRFRREVRAAGSLHHTNIVPIFEVGEKNGVPYYTMQFIRGQSLELVIAELRRLSRGEPGSGGRHVPSSTATVPQREADSIAESLLSGTFVRASGAAPDDPLSYGSQIVAPGSSRAEEGDGLTVPSPEDHNLATARRTGYFRRVARLGLQVADALSYAHGQGILHRDIKPSNLILDTAGTVWITDFGLAKSDEEDLTRSGDIVGTLRYLAPERLNGHADARSDVYSLGLTLYELCTLRAAYDESDRVRLIKLVAHESPGSPRKVNRHIPRDLETIILKAIDRHPHARYQSAEELADDLRLFIADRPVQARRSWLVERVWRWCRRNPALASLTASVLLLLAVVVCGSLWYGVASRQQAEQLQRQAQLLRASERETLRALLDARQAQAQASRKTGLRGRRVDGLAAVHDAAALLPRLYGAAGPERDEAQLRLRNEAIANLANPDLRSERSWAVEEPETAEIAFSPDLSRYAQANTRGEIVVRQVDDGREVTRFPAQSSRAWSLAFSPDGQFLAARYHPPRQVAQRVCVWNVATGERVVSDQGPHWFARYCFSSDSRTFAVALQDRTVRRYDLPGGHLKDSVSTECSPLDLALDPLGRWLVVSDAAAYRLEWIRLSDGVRKFMEVPKFVQGMAWAEDGSLLAAGCEDNNIYLWNPEDLDSSPRVLRGHAGAVVQLVFNHQRDRLISYAWDGSTRLWDLNTDRQLVRADGFKVSGRQFSADDRRIGYVTPRSNFGIWEVLDHGPLYVLPTTVARRSSVDYASDRPLLVSATSEGVELWETRQARRRAVLPTGPAAMASFTPDGTAIMVSGGRGVHRWPIAKEGATWRIGPPRMIDARAGGSFVLHPRGTALTALLGSSVVTLATVDAQRPPITLGHHDRSHDLAISPDGRWIVTTAWQMGTGIRIWDTAKNTLATDLNGESGAAFATFSPDGQWLAVGVAHRILLLEAGSWKLVRQFDKEADDSWVGPLVFAPHSQVLAGLSTRQLIELIEVPTGRPLAVLESSEPAPIGRMQFSADGNELAVVVDPGLQIWKLDQLQQELSKASLGWSPSPPPASPPADDLPVRIEVLAE